MAISVPFGNGLPYLGVSRLFMEGYTSNCVDYNLDNIRFAVSVVPPEISVQPQSQVGYWGKSVTLSVTATNRGPFTYQWFKDGIAILGATNSTLVLTNLDVSNAGSYTVVVANSMGSIASAAAMVTVSPAATSLAMYTGLTIDGVAGRTYCIQCATNVNQTNWVTLTNLTLTSPVEVWIDMGSAGQSKRFYRVTIP